MRPIKLGLSGVLVFFLFDARVSRASITFRGWHRGLCELTFFNRLVRGVGENRRSGAADFRREPRAGQVAAGPGGAGSGRRGGAGGGEQGRGRPARAGMRPGVTREEGSRDARGMPTM